MVSRAHVQSGRLDFGGESHAGDGVKWWPFLMMLTVVIVLVPRSVHIVTYCLGEVTVAVTFSSSHCGHRDCATVQVLIARFPPTAGLPLDTNPIIEKHKGLETPNLVRQF